jgi:signal transduction histidine kinase/CheY-like chemotaxis protein
MNHIINKIENERIYSAMYLGMQEETTFNQVNSSRKIVDQEIAETLLFLNKKVLFSKQKKFLKKILKTLTEIREVVDILEGDYRSNLFENYENRIIIPLNQNIEILGQRFLEEYKSELFAFQELMKMKHNLNKETTFISFILSNSKKMTLKELQLWENIINNDSTPDFSHLKNSKIANELSESLNPLHFANIKNYERAKIFNGVLKGKYKLPIEKWLNVSTSKIDKINVAQTILFINMKSSLNREIALLEKKIMNMFFTILFFFLLILMFLYLIYNIRKNSLYLTETLKDIEAELNEKQKLEIQEVIKKNNTIEIYKFLANAIKEPSREKDNFLANMSHEIRTPLNGIIGFTNLLKAEKLYGEQLEFVNIIEESSNNLLHIVNDILDFAKVSSGKIEFEYISFNIMEKFESCVDSYTIKASQKNIELGLFIDPELPTEIIGDPTKISQVILNLLSNAIKFTPNEGQINISIVKVAETSQDIDIKFSVKDSGIGIEDEKKSKIFDAFSQADASTNRKFGGTGLGLTISSKFVELMNGKLQIESQKDEGSTFFFTLKLKRSTEAKPQIQRKYPKLNIGYISSGGLLENEIDKNLEKYIKYFKANFKIYNRNELFLDKVLPDILFINERCIPSKELFKRFLRLDTKVVLITTPNSREYLHIDRKKIEKIIYKPLNFSKVTQTLELGKKIEKEVAKTITTPENFTNMNILVAEDNIINQKLIFNILKNLNTNITLASNGKEAFEKFKNQSYDIILMDIEMPIMSGIEATQEIIRYEKEHKRIHTPIVALTANPIQRNQERYSKEGMDEFLEKPLQIQKLKEILQKHFRPKIEGKALKNSHVLLYKETKLSGKIYEAILNNLGYKVDISDSEDEFRRKISTNNYKFALFDAKLLSTLNAEETQNTIVELIKNSGAIPFAFTEDSQYQRYCKTIKSKTNAQELESFLKQA